MTQQKSLQGLGSYIGPVQNQEVAALSGQNPGSTLADNDPSSNYIYICLHSKRRSQPFEKGLMSKYSEQSVFSWIPTEIYSHSVASSSGSLLVLKLQVLKVRTFPNSLYYST